MTTPAVDSQLHTARAREQRLVAWLAARGSVLVGFSGGVDSTYLACVALDALGPERVLAVIGRSESYPVEQWERAREIAGRFALPVLEVDTGELADPRYAANPSNRCYFCKSELWSQLAPIARDRGLTCVVDGTNADDLGDWRPGAAAARERGVESPLAELGFTKDEIRALSRERGIPTWSQPSSPCLSSRIPYGTSVTVERLRDVESAERALRAIGVAGDLRVRHHGPLARVELAGEELQRWLMPEASARLRDAVRSAGFARVALDVRGVSAPATDAERAAPDAEGLERALRAAGIACVVDAFDRLAVIVPGPDGVELGDASLRRRALALLPQFGFTHLALELTGPTGGEAGAALHRH